MSRRHNFSKSAKIITGHILEILSFEKPFKGHCCSAAKALQNQRHVYLHFKKMKHASGTKVHKNELLEFSFLFNIGVHKNLCLLVKLGQTKATTLKGS